MDKFAQIIGDKVGDMVEGAVKNAMGVEDKKKDKKKGGGLSIFGGGKGEKKEEKGGIFSFGHDDKKKNKEEDKGFFSKILDKADDKDKGMQKKTGFQGLFAEGEGGAAMGGEEGAEAGGNPGQTVAVTDRDLFDDLLDVAEETTNN